MLEDTNSENSSVTEALEKDSTEILESGDNWADTATSILFSVLLFLAIYLTAKLYGLVKGNSLNGPRRGLYGRQL